MLKGGNMRCFIIVVILALTACKSASDLNGSWVGKSGPFKATLKLDNGAGKLCYSGKYQGVDKFNVEWAKYHAGIIHTESGNDLVIISVSDKSIVIDVDSNGIERYVFVRDDKRVKSTWYCRKMLR